MSAGMNTAQLPLPSYVHKSVASFFPVEFIQLKGSQHKERIASTWILCLSLLHSEGIQRNSFSDPTAPHITTKEICCTRRKSGNIILACSYDDIIQTLKKTQFHPLRFLLDNITTVLLSLIWIFWRPNLAYLAQPQNTVPVHWDGKNLWRELWKISVWFISLIF